MSSLGLTCCRGDLEGARKAISRGEDVNDKDGVFDQTPLMWAVTHQHNSIVKLLLEQPTLDLNLTDSNGMTALNFATYNGNVEGIKLLLADPRLNTHNLEDADGDTPVMTAFVVVSCKNVDVLTCKTANPLLSRLTRIEGRHCQWPANGRHSSKA